MYINIKYQTYICIVKNVPNLHHINYIYNSMQTVWVVITVISLNKGKLNQSSDGQWDEGLLCHVRMSEAKYTHTDSTLFG